MDAVEFMLSVLALSIFLVAVGVLLLAASIRKDRKAAAPLRGLLRDEFADSSTPYGETFTAPAVTAERVRAL